MTVEPAIDATAYKVREHVGPHDRSSIFGLLNNSGFFLTQEMAYGMDLLDEHLRRGENSSYKFIIYEQDGQLLGYACYGPIRYSDRRFHLHWMTVERHHQHQGLGGIIEAAITQKIRALGGVKIYAEVSNRDQHIPVRLFYEKCGYMLAGTIHDYYADGSDVMFYAKNL